MAECAGPKERASLTRFIPTPPRRSTASCATAGQLTVVEVEEIVETGSIDPDDVHLPGIYVNRIVLNANPEKRIEKRTVRHGA